MLDKLFHLGLIAGLVITSYGFAYRFGQEQGQKTVSALWVIENKRRDDAYALLKKQTDTQQTAHTKRQQELSNELDAANHNFQVALANARVDFSTRLHSSETRAGIYQRQARGSTVEQERLARHAAELDRSLEEGRALVRELGETLGQRDRTVYTLGQLILNDRTLITGEIHGS